MARTKEQKQRRTELQAARYRNDSVWREAQRARSSDYYHRNRGSANQRRWNYERRRCYPGLNWDQTQIARLMYMTLAGKVRREACVNNTTTSEKRARAAADRLLRANAKREIKVTCVCGSTFKTRSPRRRYCSTYCAKVMRMALTSLYPQGIRKSEIPRSLWQSLYQTQKISLSVNPKHRRSI